MVASTPESCDTAGACGIAPKEIKTIVMDNDIECKADDTATTKRRDAQTARLVIRKASDPKKSKSIKSKDSKRHQGEDENLGFLSIEDPGSETLADVRIRIRESWDTIPEGLRFMWNDVVPVAKKQEAAEAVSDYLPVLTVRLGDTEICDGDTSFEEVRADAFIMTRSCYCSERSRI